MTENYHKIIYNESYCVKDGYLYEMVERKGKVTMVRLCDYVPVLKSEITFDDGAELHKAFEIGAVHPPQSQFHIGRFQLSGSYGFGSEQSVQESDYPERQGQGETYLLSGGNGTASYGDKRRTYEVQSFFLSDSLQWFPQK